jgi:membrane protein implicated in regulation of membrane protease activity
MANELKIPHVIVSLIYMALQAVIVVGLILCINFSYWYLGAVILILSICYLIFKKKYFRLHKTIPISAYEL